jgi:hypothetical protein
MKKIFCLFFIAVSLAASSQNLEKVGKKDMITVGGGMNYTAVIYDADGMENRRDPFSWYFNGNINVNILDVSLPFTFSYTNNRSQYTQPFNMQSCHPKYKWAQAHLGTTAINFSSYTLAGHIFTGAAVELTPRGFYFGAMYGRLKKAIAADAATNTFEGLSFRRMGYAAKLGFEKNGNALTASFFSAKDEPSSLLFVPPGADLFPQQNSAVSISGKLKLHDAWTAEGEFAVSGLTRNILSADETTDFSGFEKWLLPTRTTTQFFRAWKGALTYSAKSFSISIRHEHVDPDYQTFGAYYFSNDLENWTIAPAFRLLKGKLSVALSTGIQKNNLDGSKLATAHRWVGSASVTAVPAKWLTLAAAFSNFTSYTNRRPQTDPFWQPAPTDTLSFYQVAQQANGNAIITFGNKQLRQVITLVSSWQLSRQQQLGIEAPATKVLNENVSYSLQFVPQHFTITLIANYNQSQSDTILSQFFGPGMQLSHSPGKGQWRYSAATIYNRAMLQEKLASNILSHRAQLTWSPKLKDKKYGRPTASAQATYVTRFPVSSGRTTAELTVTINLGYGF